MENTKYEIRNTEYGVRNTEYGVRLSTDDEQKPDVAAILAELREQIRERRARFTVSDADGPHALNLAELRRSVESVNDTWFVSAHLPITWDMRVVGRLGAYTKRAVRVLLRWYINPIVEQQNRFNSSVARTLVETFAYQERMTREWQDLEERVACLEDGLLTMDDQSEE